MQGITNGTPNLKRVLSIGNTATTTPIYLGPDNEFVILSDGSQSEITASFNDLIIQTSDGANMIFTSDGNMTFGSSGSITLTSSNGLPIQITSDESFTAGGFGSGSNINLGDGEFSLTANAGTYSLGLDIDTKQMFTNANGFAVPNLTTTQRNNISDPRTGLIIFNTTTSKLQCFTGSAWVDLH